MEHRFRWMAVLAIVLVGVVVGTIAYNAGMSHGLAVSAPAVAAQGAPAPAVYYRYHPWGFGFFPLGILFFWFLVARLLFWGGGRRWHRYGPYYPGPYDPPSFDEWHRRAHERMNNQPKE
jgi:hypothetical protein